MPSIGFVRQEDSKGTTANLRVTTPENGGHSKERQIDLRRRLGGKVRPANPLQRDLKLCGAEGRLLR